MRKVTRRVISLLCCIMFVIASFAGCGNNNEKTGNETGGTDASSTKSTGNEPTAAGEKEEEVVITLWNNDILSTGIQNNPVADAIAEATGVRIEIANGDSQKFKVLMAGGDLPDIIYSNLTDNGVDWATLVSSGQIMAMDDLVANNSTTIKNDYSDVINYSKEFMSTDGKLYLLPIQKFEGSPENPVVDYAGAHVAFYSRYDLYKKVGSPLSETPSDYLKTLKAMQDINQTTETGEKVFALSGFSDWGLWMWTVPYQYSHGVVSYSYGMEYDLVNKKPMATYYSEPFWDGLKFWNEAYNMGIVDPEIFTQTYDNYLDKLKNGQSLVGYANWIYNEANGVYVANGHDDWGLELVDNGFEYIYGGFLGDSPFGWTSGYELGITTNCKNTEKAMELLDFLYSEEGGRLIGSGVEGIHWEYGPDGNPQMTQAYYDGLAADTNYLQTQGLKYQKFSGYNSDQLLADGYPADLTKAVAEKAKLLNPIDFTYIEDSGVDAQFAGQVTASKITSGEYHTVTDLDMTPSLVKAPSDDTKTTAALVDEYMKVAIAEAVMASPEEFDSIKEKIISEIDEKGYDAVASEMLALWADAAKIAENWSK
jgi:putative aldouronate transport system substrate-binding protein